MEEDKKTFFNNKRIASLLLLLFLAISMPLAVLLVQTRQRLKREAIELRVYLSPSSYDFQRNETKKIFMMVPSGVNFRVAGVDLEFNPAVFDQTVIQNSLRCKEGLATAKKEVIASGNLKKIRLSCYVPGATGHPTTLGVLGEFNLKAIGSSGTATHRLVFKRVKIPETSITAGLDGTYTIEKPAPTGTAASPTPSSGLTPTAGTPTPTEQPACLRGNLGNLDCGANGVIDIADLNLLLTAWAPNGPVPSTAPGKNSADIVVDGKVDILDLSRLLDNWGTGSTTPTVSPSPTVSPTPSYPRAPAVNYKYPEYWNSNDDFNTLYPSGAPWGSILTLYWSRINPGDGQYNWQGIDTWLARAAQLGKKVIIKVLPYQSDIPGGTDIPASVFPCTQAGKSIEGWYTDLTPDWVKTRVGGSYYFRPREVDNDSIPLQDDYCLRNAATTCWSVAVMPKYDHPQYLAALKKFILAFGQKYNNDSRVGGIIFGQGIDGEFGEFTKGQYGNCKPKSTYQFDLPSFMGGNYVHQYVIAGSNNDYTDWYATSFPNKPVYHQVTGGGKAVIPRMMAQGYLNLGIHQASLLPDHSWFSDSANQGIMDIVMPWIGRRPIGWENALPANNSPERTAGQFVYTLFLAMLQTFPDFFDFPFGTCVGDQTALNHCNWAKQYYGRTPQNTNEVWIAFQQTVYPMPSVGGAVRYGGWARDWEYGLSLVSNKGTTLWRQSFTGHPESGLKELFNQTVADAYSGQARKVNVGETMLLIPHEEWPGVTQSSASNYELKIIYVGNSGKVKVEVGDNTLGWFTNEWDKDNSSPVNWHVKTLTSNKKPLKIKITPTTGDPLYLHMVKIKLL